MPTKSLQFRARRARAEGTTVAAKDVELGIERPLSSHAAKKSSHTASLLEPAERHAHQKAPPGAGRSRWTAPMRSAAEAAQHRKSELGVGTIPGAARNKRRR